MASVTPRSAVPPGPRSWRPGRASRDELTVYKSMGTVIEDVAAAGVVLERAAALGAGRRVRL